MQIISRDNPAFRRLQQLTQKKHRREHGLCIIEGEKIVREYNDTAVSVFRRGTDLGEKLFDEISNLENGSTVLAIIPIPKPREVTFPYLVLDGIQDPGNMGTLLRTAAAFGFNTVFCLDCADAWSQKVLRSSVGAALKLNILDTFHEVPNGSELYIADIAGGTVRQTPKNERFGIVLGSEGRGVSQFMKNFPHKTVTIPLKNDVESLNVAVAGGIIMHSMTSEVS